MLWLLSGSPGFTYWISFAPVFGFITERLMMGRKEYLKLNKTKQKISINVMTVAIIERFCFLSGRMPAAGK